MIIPATYVAALNTAMRKHLGLTGYAHASNRVRDEQALAHAIADVPLVITISGQVVGSTILAHALVEPRAIPENAAAPETAAHAALVALLAAMQDNDDVLNDHTKPSGSDCPTGDDYNTLFDLVINACRAAGIPTHAS